MRHKVILITVVLIGFAESLNETKIVFSDGDPEHLQNSFVASKSNVTSRNSRQLWSIFKNVVKSTLENNKGSSSNSNSNNANPVSGGLGALASLFGSASGINSQSQLSGDNGAQQLTHASVNTRPQYAYPPPYSNPHQPPNQYTNPNEYMHWLLLNSQQNQHESIPHYQIQKQQKEKEGLQEMIDKYKEQMQASGSENVETGSAGLGNTGSQILNKLAFGSVLDNLDLDNLGSILSFGRFEGMIEKVNKFDRLKCIPRLLCQMVAKRQEDAKSGTTTTTTRPGKATRREENDADDDDDDDDDNDKDKGENDKDRKDANPSDKERKVDSRKDDPSKDEEKSKNEPKKKDKPKESAKEDDEEENDEEGGNNDDDDDEEDDESSEEEHGKVEYEIIKPGTDGGENQGRSMRRQARIFKINGADAALEQFVKFLELMQLKDWSLYPYLHGAYQGHQVSRSEDCAYRFSTCPFSDDQLVYYFNNYNNGIFHSIF